MQTPPQASTAPLIADVLSKFVAELTLDAIPAPVQERAKQLILDATGIAHASTHHDFARSALAAVSTFGAGESEVIGMSARLALRDAVLLNGILVHGLDFDDTYLPGGLHVTASVFPCALAMAADLDLSGSDLLVAYIAGVEAAARLSAVAKGRLHLLGFHPTGLVAAFGCALTAGKLLGLDTAQLTTAQGVTLSTASGSSRAYSQNAAWTKRMHPGWAGVAGITAAAFARAGFIGARAVYEGRYGFFPMHLGDAVTPGDYRLATADLGRKWEIEQVAVKPFPIGQLSVACLDCAIVLAQKHAIRSRDVRSIHALVPKEAIPIVCEPLEQRRRPATGYAAQFSLQYAIACGLVRGRFGLAELEDAALSDPEILAVVDKVSYAIDPKSEYPKHYSGELTVVTHDGREFTHREHVNRGAAQRPLSGAKIAAKFMANTERAMPRARAEKILTLLLELEQAPSAKAVARELATAE